MALILKEATREETPKEIYHWPYCPCCREPFRFDPNEPFAWCGCPGTSEWGYPRPAPWIPEPPAGQKEEVTL